MAGAVDGVGDAESLPVIIVGPFGRVVMDADRVAAHGEDIDMMRQREILEAEIGGDVRHRGHQIVDALHRFDDADELHRHSMHPHRAATRPRAASQATVAPAVALSPALGRGGGFSRRRPALLVTEAQYHRDGAGMQAHRGTRPRCRAAPATGSVNQDG